MRLREKKSTFSEKYRRAIWYIFHVVRWHEKISPYVLVPTKMAWKLSLCVLMKCGRGKEFEHLFPRNKCSPSDLGLKLLSPQNLFRKIFYAFILAHLAINYLLQIPQAYTGDHKVGAHLRLALEELFYTYKVNLHLSGHYHRFLFPVYYFQLQTRNSF